MNDGNTKVAGPDDATVAGRFYRYRMHNGTAAVAERLAGGNHHFCAIGTHCIGDPWEKAAALARLLNGVGWGGVALLAETEGLLRDYVDGSVELELAGRIRAWLDGEDPVLNHPVEALRQLAVDWAANSGRVVDHAAFDAARAYADEPVQALGQLVEDEPRLKLVVNGVAYVTQSRLIKGKLGGVLIEGMWDGRTQLEIHLDAPQLARPGAPPLMIFGDGGASPPNAESASDALADGYGAAGDMGQGSREQSYRGQPDCAHSWTEHPCPSGPEQGLPFVFCELCPAQGMLVDPGVAGVAGSIAARQRGLIPVLRTKPRAAGDPGAAAAADEVLGPRGPGPFPPGTGLTRGGRVGESMPVAHSEEAAADAAAEPPAAEPS